jgi:hypothetical protein
MAMVRVQGRVWWIGSAAATAVLLGAGLGGCASTPPVIDASGSSPNPSSAPAVPPDDPSPTDVVALPSSSPSAPSVAVFPEGTAVSCAGQPTADRVIALVRARGMISTSAGVTVRIGPLCAGTWQYTVLDVTGHEPLQVVSSGAPNALTLVTAGTDVCSIPVRSGAPSGIIAAAQCN